MLITFPLWRSAPLGLRQFPEVANFHSGRGTLLDAVVTRACHPISSRVIEAARIVCARTSANRVRAKLVIAGPSLLAPRHDARHGCRPGPSARLVQAPFHGSDGDAQQAADLYCW